MIAQNGKEGQNHGPFSLCHRKLRPMTQKTLRGIALRRSGRVSLKRPAADGESCLQDSISFGHLQLLVFQQVLVSHTGLARSPDEPEEASGMGMLWQCRGP